MDVHLYQWEKVYLWWKWTWLELQNLEPKRISKIIQSLADEVTTEISDGHILECFQAELHKIGWT